MTTTAVPDFECCFSYIIANRGYPNSILWCQAQIWVSTCQITSRDVKSFFCTYYFPFRRRFCIIDGTTIFRRSSNFVGVIRNMRKINFSSISLAASAIPSNEPFYFLSANIFRAQDLLLDFLVLVLCLLCKAERLKRVSKPS